MKKTVTSMGLAALVLSAPTLAIVKPTSQVYSTDSAAYSQRMVSTPSVRSKGFVPKAYFHPEISYGNVGGDGSSGDGGSSGGDGGTGESTGSGDGGAGYRGIGGGDVSGFSNGDGN